MNQASKTVNEILSDLKSSDPAQRDVAAHAALDFAGAAVDALFDAIARPENRRHTGTLIYVLKAFNCHDRFPDLFHLALTGSYEAQCHAISILQSQTFATTPDQIDEARRSLAGLRERAHLPDGDAELLRVELQAVLSRVADGSPDAP